MGEGEKRKEGLTQNHSANRVTHPKSRCGSNWITHNNPLRHRPQVNTSRAIGKKKPLKFFIDVLISCGSFMDRDAERNSKRLQKALSSSFLE